MVLSFFILLIFRLITSACASAQTGLAEQYSYSSNCRKISKFDSELDVLFDCWCA